MDLKRTLSNCETSHEEVIEDVFKNLNQPFQGLETEALQGAYIRDNFHYVPFNEIELGKVIVRKKVGLKFRLCEKAECFIYIPIIKSLEQFLSNKRLRSMVLRPANQTIENVFFDISDGSICKNDPYFQEHPNGLKLILYHDEVEICNPLDFKAGKHKLDMYYYVLINIEPKYRSKRSAVRPVVITNANYVKKYGIHQIMDPIIRDLKKLYSGVTIHIGMQNIEVFGKIVVCVGDTLGQHLWGGL